MKTINILIGFIIGLSLISCSSEKKNGATGFVLQDYETVNTRTSTPRTTLDVGDNCPLIDLVSANNDTLYLDVFWPNTATFQNLFMRVDGYGYYLTYYDLERVGIYGANPCNTLAAMYGFHGSGIEETGELSAYLDGKYSVTNGCVTFIESYSTYAFIQEDYRYAQTCSVTFYVP